MAQNIKDFVIDNTTGKEIPFHEWLGRRMSLLEISQEELASAIDVSKKTIQNYLDGEAYNRDYAIKIRQFLNSCEYYKGYFFHSRRDFAELLDSVLNDLKSEITAAEFGKTVNRSPKNISNIRNKEMTAPTNVVDQYEMLLSAYHACSDNTGYTKPELIDLKEKLSNILCLKYPKILKQNFAEIINESLKDIDYEDVVLKESLDISTHDLDELCHDENYPFDVNKRFDILQRLRDYCESFYYDVPKILSDTLRTLRWCMPRNTESDREEAEAANENLYGFKKYPTEVQEMILNYSYAFFENDWIYNEMLGNYFDKYMDSCNKHENIVLEEKGYRNEEGQLCISEFGYKHGIANIFTHLSKDCKESIINKLASKINTNIKYPAGNVEEHYFSVMADLYKMTQITAETGSIYSYYKVKWFPDNKVYPSPNKKQIQKNYEPLLHNISSYKGTLSIIDYKLSFDSADWYFWLLLTAAIHTGYDLTDTIKEITEGLEPDIISMLISIDD